MTSPAVEVRGLQAGYGDRLILKGVDMVVPRGQIRVILGGSGCGKSTLMKSIIGLTPVKAGEIELMGVNLTTLSEDDRAAQLRQVGVVFQSGALIGSMTVGENVALPLHEHTKLPDDAIAELVRMKLELTNMAFAQHLYPGQLSGGMRKRASLSRAMALDPPVLFCDEPSAGLDPLSSAELDHLLLQLRDLFGMTMVVVTHELSSIEAIADSALMLVGGKAVAEGTLKEIRSLGNKDVNDFFGRSPGEERLRGQTLRDRLMT